MGRITIILLAGLSVSVFASCKEKVDCEKLKEKLTTCMMENYKALNKDGRNLDDPQFSSDKKKISAQYLGIIDKEFIEKCNANSGRDERASKINKCLAQSSCQDVHSCLKSVLN